MAVRFCPSCFAELDPEVAFCRRCLRRDDKLSRLPLLLGIVGVPTLFAGVLGLDSRLSLAGAVVALVAVAVHIVLAMR